MFCTTYNLEKFGNEVKKIRKNLNLSQNDVKAAICISTNTIRRLEKGETIPTFDTIELLSTLYKKNLLTVLQKYKISPSLYNIYNEIDNAIINQNPKMIENIISSIETLKTLNNNELQLVDYSHYSQLIQFLAFLTDATIYNDELNYDYIMKLEKCLRITIPDFKLTKLDSYNYNHIELRILLLIALIYGGNKNYRKSLNILKKIKDKININEHITIETIKILLKIVANLSYTYYIIEGINKSLESANEGIDLCIKYDTNYIKYFFFARKGIAKYLLNKNNYLKDLYYSICLLDIDEKHELKEIYVNAFREKHNISFPFIY